MPREKRSKSREKDMGADRDQAGPGAERINEMSNHLAFDLNDPPLD
jgi:hypothetical protein